MLLSKKKINTFIQLFVPIPCCCQKPACFINGFSFCPYFPCSPDFPKSWRIFFRPSKNSHLNLTPSCRRQLLSCWRRVLTPPPRQRCQNDFALVFRVQRSPSASVKKFITKQEEIRFIFRSTHISSCSKEAESKKLQSKASKKWTKQKPRYNSCLNT